MNLCLSKGKFWARLRITKQTLKSKRNRLIHQLGDIKNTKQNSNAEENKKTLNSYFEADQIINSMKSLRTARRIIKQNDIEPSGVCKDMYNFFEYRLNEIKSINMDNLRVDKSESEIQKLKMRRQQTRLGLGKSRNITIEDHFISKAIKIKEKYNEEESSPKLSAQKKLNRLLNKNIYITSPRSRKITRFENPGDTNRRLVRIELKDDLVQLPFLSGRRDRSI